MTREWAEQKTKEHAEKIENLRNTLIANIKQLPKATEDQKNALVEQLNKEERSGSCCMSWLLKLKVMGYMYDDSLPYETIRDNLPKNFSFDEFDDLVRSRHMYSRYIDSDPVHFDGDIIITDPCYVIDERTDWDACEYGERMEPLGIHTYMTHDTLYGDWSCTTFNTDTQQPIGEFCADAGLVSVFLLDEVLAYNPSYTDHIKKAWTTTLIRDFKGEVQFVIEHEIGQYESDSEYWKAGDTREDYSLHVVGHGINKVTGEPINFRTSQTGL